MIVQRPPRGRAYTMPFPMWQASTPTSLAPGLTVSLAAYSAPLGGAFTALAVAGVPSEIGATGAYESALTAAEMSHDQILCLLTSATAADQVVLLETVVPLTADLVAASRTWILSQRGAPLASQNIVKAPAAFEGTLAMDFERILNRRTSLTTVTSVVDAAGVTPPLAIASIRLSQDRLRVLFDVASLTDAATYRIFVSAQSTDGQILPGIGTLVCQNDP